jgi:hypothetical protein
MVDDREFSYYEHIRKQNYKQILYSLVAYLQRSPQ